MNDTPTSGRFYIRVEREDWDAVWGDYDVEVSSGQLINDNRTLYGGRVQYRSLQTTQNGDARVSATAYAAQPETRPQRDVLLGTGGSAYFLSRQDINYGSENLRIEVKDRNTGRVLERQTLIAGRDYSFDYIQGVVILTDPLNSSRSTGALVTDNPIGDTIVELVVDYEFTPGLADVDGTSVGGSLEGWITDDFSLKVTGLRDTTDSAEIEVGAITGLYTFGENSWVEAEIAASNGAGIGSNVSTDGGLTYTVRASGSDTSSGGAYRFETYVDFQDLGSTLPGDINIFAERREAGFSTLTQTFATTETLFGVTSTFNPSDRLEFRLAGESFERDTGQEDREATAEVAYQLTQTVAVEAGVTFSDQSGFTTADEEGQRTDIGARVTYAPNEDTAFYLFGQATVQTTETRSDNNRLGVGTTFRLTEKLSFEGEVSDGDTGVGALARLLYQPTADNQVYLGYSLDPSRTITGSSLRGRDNGVIVAGSKRKHSEQVSTFAEHTYDLFGDRTAITEAYGVTYTPDSTWTFNGGLEVGEISDPDAEDFDRYALSLGASYDDDNGLEGSLKLEYRNENGDGVTRDRDTWLASGGVEYKHSDNWRLLSTADVLISESDESAFRDGRYVEVSFGAAYRPVDNEKINALFKLTYLDDQPGENQVNADDVVDGSAQRSIILSADGLYDINEKLTLGAKYGYRMGEVAPRGTNDFTSSTAHLFVLGADWHVVHKWDVFGELRYLYTEETDTQESGALLGIYRHIGNNAKVGLGYEWGGVSDEVADIDYTNSGVFLNLVAKF